MLNFIQQLANPSMSFLLYAFLTGAVASVAFGIIGTYVVTRRITAIAGAISHCVLGGIGIALFLKLNYHLDWCTPMLGAVVSALLSAIIIGLVSMYAKEREDTVIGAIWAIGMAIGLLFLAKTPGYIDLHGYLFGNILLVNADDFKITLLLDLLILIPAILLFNNFLAVCFDSRFAELRGLRIKLTYLLLLCMTALTIVLMVTIVGIIMVIALLTLPAAVAGYFTRRIWSMMSLAILLSLAFTSSGLVVSYKFDLPSGPVIVVIAGACYVLTILYRLALKRIFKK
jgi:zinc transport system permease protein